MATTADSLAKPAKGAMYNQIYISGSGKVQLGDIYTKNKDVFDSGTAEQQHQVTMNLLYYEGLDFRREQLALSDVGPDSFAWIEDTAFPDWLKSDDKPFWIRGKPGSGKSTLMKYLAESQRTSDRIKADGGNWTIVYFFFDYRAGRRTANRVLGMLKLFLRQLSTGIRGFQPLLVEKEARAAIRSDNEEKYIDVIVDTLKLVGFKVCAFIDGLDEYEGDLWELANTLERLRDRSGMKMCLAGRPETAFETMFAKYQSLTMQEYNTASMKVYIERKVAKLLVVLPFAEHLFPPTLQEAIVEKAQGVLLWARLVVDEMIKSCSDNATITEMEALLESLPAELEPLYERILGKTNEKYQRETALFLHLIIENPGLTTATLLYQAWSFLQDTHSEESGPALQLDSDAYEPRLKALLGNLVDLVKARHKPRGHWSFVQDYDVSVSVRLIHKSLSTYLDRSAWVLQRLPPSLKTKYPDFVWRRLSFAVLDQMDQDNAINITYLKELIGKRTQDKHQSQNEVAVFQEEWLQKPKWRHRRDLLSYCSSSCFEIDFQSYSEQGQLNAALNFKTDSHTASLFHYMRCRKCLDYTSSWWDARRVERIHKAGALGWVLNVLHGCYSWASNELERLIQRLSDRILNDLFDIALILEPWRHGGRAGAHRELLNSFSKHGICVEGRHICSLLQESSHIYSLRSRAVIEAVTWRPLTRAWSPKHDKDCPNSLTGSDVCSHLENGYLSSFHTVALLRLCQLLGADVLGSKRSATHGKFCGYTTAPLFEELERYRKNGYSWANSAPSWSHTGIGPLRLNVNVRPDIPDCYSGGFDENMLHALLESVSQRDLTPDEWLQHIAKTKPRIHTGISGRPHERGPNCTGGACG